MAKMNTDILNTIGLVCQFNSGCGSACPFWHTIDAVCVIFDRMPREWDIPDIERRLTNTVASDSRPAKEEE